MSRSGYPSVMFLEFKDGHDRPRITGSDAIFYVDGRWSRETVHTLVSQKVRSMRRYYKDEGFKCVGYGVRGDHSTIRHLPAIVNK